MNQVVQVHGTEASWRLPQCWHVASSPLLLHLWLSWQVYFYLSLLKMSGEGRGVPLLSKPQILKTLPASF